MATTDVERLVVSLEASAKKFENAMARAVSTTNSSMSRVERRTEQASKRIESAFTRIGSRVNSALAGVFAGISVQQVAQYADAYTKVQNSLRVAGLEGEALKRTYDQLFAMAQRQAAPIEALATLYGRLSVAQKELNVTGPELMRFTEGVATALRVSGQSATEAQGALLQLSQALSGGKIQAEEYNSLIDGARPVLQAVAAGLEEAGGSVAKLTALVKDGKVSSEAFFRAFEAGQYVLDDMAKNTVPTLGQGMQRVYNALTDAAGKMNEAAGATAGFQKAIDWLVDDISKIPAGLQATIHELERIIELFGQAKAMAREGLASVGVLDQQNRIDKAFDADSYAVHGSMRGYKPPAAEGGPLTMTVKPRRTVSLSNYAVPGDEKGGGKSSRERVNELQREIEQIQQRTRALDVERQTVGLSAGDAAKAEAAFRLLEAAKEANVTVTPQLKAQIDSLAAAYGVATQKIEDAQKAQEAVADAAQEVGSMLSNAFQDAILEGEELDDVLKKLAKSLASKAFDNIFANLFGGVGGSGGGLLDGLFKMFAPGRAMGGSVSAGQPYTVGENGRELFVPTTPGKIIPNGKLGGGNMQVQIFNNAGAQVSTRQTQGPQGPRLEVQIEQMLDGMIAGGRLDKSLKGRFGVSPMRGR